MLNKGHQALLNVSVKHGYQPHFEEELINCESLSLPSDPDPNFQEHFGLQGDHEAVA